MAHAALGSNVEKTLYELQHHAHVPFSHFNCIIIQELLLYYIILYKATVHFYTLIKLLGFFFISSQILTRIYPSQSYKFAVDCDVMQL